MAHSDLQAQLDELLAQLQVNRADIDALEAGPEAARERADRAEARADDAERRSDVDREMIAELQADGAVSREHVEQLERALATSRTIGAAVGILMASRNLTQAEALQVLKDASARSNTPMRELAEVILAGPAGESIP